MLCVILKTRTIIKHKKCAPHVKTFDSKICTSFSNSDMHMTMINTVIIQVIKYKTTYTITFI